MDTGRFVFRFYDVQQNLGLIFGKIYYAQMAIVSSSTELN
jgi:hypothetical protein